MFVLNLKIEYYHLILQHHLILFYFPEQIFFVEMMVFVFPFEVFVLLQEQIVVVFFLLLEKQLVVYFQLGLLKEAHYPILLKNLFS